MSWYVRKKYGVKWVDNSATKTWSVQNIRSIYDKLHFDILLLEAMLTDRIRRKSTIKKKIQIKAWYMTLGTEISSYEEFHGKFTQISEEKKLYQAKRKYSRQLSLCNKDWLRFNVGNDI